MKRTSILFLLILLFGFGYVLFSESNETETNGKNRITDFQKAKRVLKRFYEKVGKDFYCGCEFEKDEEEFGRFKIKQNTCGLQARKDSKRQNYIEWEHIVPAYSFGKTRECWTKTNCEVGGKLLKGRKCCGATDPEFNLIEADLHNIVPVPGEINADRGIFPYGEIEGEPREYGLCDFEVNFKASIAEPKPDIRGDIARIYFYMEWRYQIPIPEGKRKLYQNWHENDPPDTFEIRKNEIVERLQKIKNPFVEGETPN
ncbi:nuclease, EndA/NucM family [Leptospira ellinghausenii]|uniref:Nuclease, EndA/NucM family n=1 Tax=Leptospira ellinghausenii TaxID=1917822 RepID=A0A2P2DA97_9LEPT|nr:endonuclease [Leptospira ellinghausenii]GBF41478.1 nuclease, EndA/NucM family [Leptospira ellinghausenii]